ncbi:phage head-tail connector protein [[Clostridium] innocuum]|nr:phage head-tail connector protein [[Clostridium] innocuum]MCR0575881.1 phage head-tail connector protein [[Clostridium] innocuum]
MMVQDAIKRLTGCSDEDAKLYAELAEQDILRETNRTAVPAMLLSTQIDIAVIRYNRQGTEGETSRSEGGISSSFESMPEYIRNAVKNKRLAGVGGYAFEKKPD